MVGHNVGPKRESSAQKDGPRRGLTVEDEASSKESIALEGVFLPVEIEAPAEESHASPARIDDVAADPGPAVLAQRVEIAWWTGGAFWWKARRRWHRSRVWCSADGTIPLPSNTRVWLAAGVTDMWRGFSTAMLSVFGWRSAGHATPEVGGEDCSG
ncbi:MAG: hypothetical protein ACXIUW_00555 [Roseinatronobacter sp.]